MLASLLGQSQACCNSIAAQPVSFLKPSTIITIVLFSSMNREFSMTNHTTFGLLQ